MTDSAVRPADLLARASDLDRRARSEEALQLLEGCGDWPVPYNERALTMRAGILAVTDPIAALDVLPESPSASTTRDGRVEYFLASARAYLTARNTRSAGKMLEIAAAEISGDKRQYRYSYVMAYLRAYVQWLRREYEPAGEDWSYAMHSPDPAMRVRALNLRAWMYAGQENFRLQMSDVLDCLALYRQYSELCRVRSIAITLQTVAIGAWELSDAEAASRAAEVYENFPWTPQVQAYRFLVLRGLAWFAFLRGDAAHGKRLIHECKMQAPSAAWRVIAYVDFAHMAAIGSEVAVSTRAIEAAQAIASAVDWETTRDEEHMALLPLAALVAPIDGGEAKRYLAIYHRFQPHRLREAIDASYEPRRTRAYRSYAEGRVEPFHGNQRLAVRLLEDAYNIFVEIGYVFRATLAEQALLALTGETRWFDAARAHAAAFA